MITHADAAMILTKISTYDQRTLGDTDVLAWHEALNLAHPPINRDDALHAVARWHADNTDGRIRPAHVIQGAQTIARRRAGAERRAQLDERLAIEGADQNDPTDRRAERDELLARVAAKLGPADPTVLRRKEWVQAEQRRQRERACEPNPYYDPSRVAEVLRRAQEDSA